jgi:hypothetical protein
MTMINMHHHDDDYDDPISGAVVMQTVWPTSFCLSASSSPSDLDAASAARI